MFFVSHFLGQRLKVPSDFGILRCRLLLQAGILLELAQLIVLSHDTAVDLVDLIKLEPYLVLRLDQLQHLVIMTGLFC